MQKGVKFVYFDNTEINIDILEDVSLSFVKKNDTAKCQIRRKYKTDLENPDYIKNLYNQISTDNLKTIEYLIENNTVDYISGYKFSKQYSVLDSVGFKNIDYTNIYEVCDIEKDDNNE